MAHVEVQTHKLEHAHVLLVTLGHGWVAGTIVAWKSIQLFASVSFANPEFGKATPSRGWGWVERLGMT